MLKSENSFDDGEYFTTGKNHPRFPIIKCLLSSKIWEDNNYDDNHEMFKDNGVKQARIILFSEKEAFLVKTIGGPSFCGYESFSFKIL